MNSIKIETLNPSVSQAIPGKQAAIPAKDTVGRAHPAPNIDTINLSIPNLQSDKNLSTLISNLIDVFSSQEVPSRFVGAIHELPLLESLYYKGEEPLSFLKDFIEKSGLLYELKMAKGDVKALDEDLKGLSLRLVERLGEKSEGGKAALALLSDIEARQLLNIKGKEEGAIYLQIPVLLPQGPSTAHIFVRRDGKGKGGYEKDNYNVGFSIELREAGLLSIDALVNRSSVSIRLQAEKAEFLEFVKSHLPELTERLAGYGMRTVVSE